jgi:biopolymer transport protein ExbD
VRAHIERLHAENPKGGLVVQADKKSTNEKLMAVLNAARAAGMREVAISTEK